jgi:predicted amidohydrolase YtcJ
MDETRPQAQAMVIEGGIITAVGDDQEILALRQADSRVIDLAGRTLMPGFVDAHSHLFNDAEASFDMSLGEIQQVGLENGITTIGDLYVNSSFLREIQAFENEGRLQIRTSLYLVATDPCGKSQGDWYREHRPSDRDFEMLRINGVKIFTDGPGCDTRPALSYEIEAGDGLGDLFHSQEDLDALVAVIHEEGYQVAIHAIGDRAVEQAQNAIVNALDGGPNSPRHRIEHNSVVRPEQIRRYGEIGIVPVVFGLYPICNPFGPPPPEAYHSWEWPYRAMLDQNPDLKLAWSGDDPFFGRVRPLDDLYSLVTRDDIDEEGQICPAPVWLRQHLVTREEALRMMTTDAAYALFRDDEVGQLKPGLAADLILLSDNPLTVETESLPQLQVKNGTARSR